MCTRVLAQAHRRRHNSGTSVFGSPLHGSMGIAGSNVSAHCQGERDCGEQPLWVVKCSSSLQLQNGFIDTRWSKGATGKEDGCLDEDAFVCHLRDGLRRSLMFEESCVVDLG